jgi:hypothetical protein
MIEENACVFNNLSFESLFPECFFFFYKYLVCDVLYECTLYVQCTQMKSLRHEIDIIFFRKTACPMNLVKIIWASGTRGLHAHRRELVDHGGHSGRQRRPSRHRGRSADLLWSTSLNAVVVGKIRICIKRFLVYFWHFGRSRPVYGPQDIFHSSLLFYSVILLSEGVTARKLSVWHRL